MTRRGHDELMKSTGKGDLGRRNSRCSVLQSRKGGIRLGKQKLFDMLEITALRNKEREVDGDRTWQG